MHKIVSVNMKPKSYIEFLSCTKLILNLVHREKDKSSSGSGFKLQSLPSDDKSKRKKEQAKRKKEEERRRRKKKKEMLKRIQVNKIYKTVIYSFPGLDPTQNLQIFFPL